MSKEEKLAKLIEAIDARGNFTAIMNQAAEMITPSVSEMKNEFGEPEDTEEIEDMNIFKKIFLEKICSRKEQIISDAGALYEKYFSEEEIDDLINFYISPTGKRVVELTPILEREKIGLSEKYVGEVIREMEDE